MCNNSARKTPMKQEKYRETSRSRGGHTSQHDDPQHLATHIDLQPPSQQTLCVETIHCPSSLSWYHAAQVALCCASASFLPALPRPVDFSQYVWYKPSHTYHTITTQSHPPCVLVDLIRRAGQDPKHNPSPRACARPWVVCALHISSHHAAQPYIP